ncbi:hypothetical protein L7F22_014357 [Adiantum nelumboides]|nr:hypothetical protein [Adiantum nelumboides]
MEGQQIEEEALQAKEDEQLEWVETSEEVFAIRFVYDEDFSKTRANLIEVFQKVFLVDFDMQCGKTNFQEFIDAESDGLQIQTKFHIIMRHVVDDKEDHNFDFEHVEEYIGMSKAEYEEGEHSITKNVLKQINLWSKLGKNESDNVLTHGVEQEDPQMEAFEEHKTGFTGFEDLILMQSAEFSRSSSMDEFVDIDVGQFLVKLNINLLEDVYFRVSSVVEVDLYREECQMVMSDCQNSDFYVLQILDLLSLGREIRCRGQNDQNLLFANWILTKSLFT